MLPFLINFIIYIKMDKSILKKLALNDKEVMVYLTLLEYGAISVRSLAELTSINRGTTYDILKKLIDLGIVSYYQKDTKQKFVAEKPERLLKLIETKEREIKETKNDIEKIIPELRLLQDKGDHSPTCKLYEDYKGLRVILEDVLEVMSDSKEKEYYLYSATELSQDMKKAFPDFTKTRIRKGIKVKAISLAKGGDLHGLDERRWLGTEDNGATFIIIYNNKCAYISRDAKDTPVGVIIENKMIYKTQKLIFMKLWDNLK